MNNKVATLLKARATKRSSGSANQILPCFPFRAVDNFRHDQQRFERIDHLFAVKRRGRGIGPGEKNIDTVNTRAALGFDPRNDFDSSGRR